MPFSEKIKQRVKERAHFKCCLCRQQWVAHIHHITPQSEGGPDTEDNAAPLCANCHDLFGGNPDKRKFIEQSRDFWYNHCEKSSPPDLSMMREMHEHLHKNVVTKTDLDNVLRPVYGVLNLNVTPSEQLQMISDITTTIATTAISTVTISDAIGIRDSVTVSLITACPKCNTHFENADICPKCGWSKVDS